MLGLAKTMTKLNIKNDTLSEASEKAMGLPQQNDSFEGSMGRVVDGEPLPGDEQIVIDHLRRHPQCVQQIESHLAMDAMLFDEARCDTRAFIESVRVSIEAEETKSVFVRGVHEAIFGSGFGRINLKCDLGDASNSQRKWLGHSVVLTLACSLLLASLLAGGIWNAAAIGQPVLVQVDRVAGTTAFTAGDQVDLRALVLPEGTVDLRLPSGVMLECQSPLMARFEHPMRLHLSRGRIDIDVGEEGAGFTVVTPVGEVVDLGTRFAVNASVDGEVRVAVLSGQVELRSQKVGTVSLFDGEAVRLSGSQAPRRLHSVEIRNHGIDHDRKDSVIHSVSDNVDLPKTRRFYGLVPSGMRDGVRAFRDRTPRWESDPGEDFPEELLGADLIQTFQTYRFQRKFQLQFSTTQPSRVYVFYDARYSPPGWLARDFVNTGIQIRSVGWRSNSIVTRGIEADAWGNVSIPHDIWCRDLKHSTSVVLGPPVLSEKDLNATSEFEGVKPSMYGIAVQPIVPPVTNIGKNIVGDRRVKAISVGITK